MVRNEKQSQTNNLNSVRLFQQVTCKNSDNNVMEYKFLPCDKNAKVVQVDKAPCY